MSTPLPAEIEVVDTGDAVRWRFPRRRLGGTGLIFGLFLVSFGVLFSGGATAFVMAALVGDHSWLGALFAIFGLLFVAIGLFPLGLGLAFLAGRSEVELRDGQLRAGDGVGPFLWWRSRPAATVRRIVIARTPVQVNDQLVTSGPLANLAILKAECEGSGPFFFALAYPCPWLEPLAHDLAVRCGTGAAPPVEVTEELLSPRKDSFVERSEQPVGSRVAIDEHADGVTLQVPPAGLRQGSRGLFVFSLLWLSFMAVFTGLVLWIPGGKDSPKGLFVAFAVVFWGIGAGMLLGAVHLGKRRRVLAVVGDSLLVMQIGPLGSRRHEWTRDAVADVRTGPSGMAVNDVPVIELQVHPREGKKVGLLAGRDEAELAWMATELRRKLRVPHPETGATWSADAPPARMSEDDPVDGPTP